MIFRVRCLTWIARITGIFIGYIPSLLYFCYALFLQESLFVPILIYWRLSRPTKHCILELIQRLLACNTRTNFFRYLLILLILPPPLSLTVSFLSLIPLYLLFIFLFKVDSLNLRRLIGSWHSGEGWSLDVPNLMSCVKLLVVILWKKNLFSYTPFASWLIAYCLKEIGSMPPRVLTWFFLRFWAFAIHC